MKQSKKWKTILLKRKKKETVGCLSCFYVYTRWYVYQQTFFFQNFPPQPPPPFWKISGSAPVPELFFTSPNNDIHPCGTSGFRVKTINVGERTKQILSQYRSGVLQYKYWTERGRNFIGPNYVLNVHPKTINCWISGHHFATSVNVVLCVFDSSGYYVIKFNLNFNKPY